MTLDSFNLAKLDTFTRAYIACALWSSTDNADESGGEPLDKNYDAEDIAPDTLARMIRDCEAFQYQHVGALIGSELSDDRAGHDFWLNRNGHGSGFWDEYSQRECEDYEREQAIAITTRDFSKRDALNQTCGCRYHICQRLSDACRAWGSFDLCIGDDGLIHGSHL